MPLYNYECPDCGVIIEKVFKLKRCPRHIKCSVCKGKARKIICIPGADNTKESPDWVKSIIEVVDKEGGAHCQRFIKNPTRKNLETWMKVEGVRHFEPGEKFSKPKAPDLSGMADAIMKKRKKDHTIEVYAS